MATKKTREGGTEAARATKKTARRKPGAAKPVLPKQIFAQVSPRSVGGVSLFDVDEQIRAETVANFASEDFVISQAVRKLQEAGFKVLQVTELTVNIAGTARQYEQAFNTKLVAEERPTVKELGREDTATFVECPETDRPGFISTKGTAFEDIIEGVALEEPRYLMAASMFPPTKSYWHLDVPADVSLGCNADKAHRSGITGRGIRVAMVDSGWFKHPFFTSRGYRAAPVVLGPGTSNPLKDEIGHGTGESANVFAVAPDVELLPVKALLAGSMNTVLVNATGAFNAGVGLNPDIITNSWGFDIQRGPLSAAEQALAAAVAAAVAAGIIVVFSAGNGHFGFPGQHPDVISAGGVFMDSNGSLRASNYASGFMSQVYANRRVPDLCGLVGMQPKAIYIMLPLEPGDAIDATPWNQIGGLQGGAHPQGDETTANDGWGAFSGTSAAAPQLAGAAALIKQACPRLTPAQVKQILISTARDVTVGNCVQRTGGHPATAGADLATGAGLVDAHKATLIAKIRCLGPRPPIRPPLPPIQPIRPIRPPITPVTPVRPIEPIRPIRPIEPIEPIRPVQPIRPIRPPVGPVAAPTEGELVTAAEAPAVLSDEDVAALEKLALQSDLDLGE
jgi:subtilisin family serine protease